MKAHSNNGISLSSAEKMLFDVLGAEFTTQDAKQSANSLGIPWKSAERYVGQFVSKYHIVDRIRNGQYRKKRN